MVNIIYNAEEGELRHGANFEHWLIDNGSEANAGGIHLTQNNSSEYARFRVKGLRPSTLYYGAVYIIAQSGTEAGGGNLRVQGVGSDDSNMGRPGSTSSTIDITNNIGLNYFAVETDSSNTGVHMLSLRQAGSSNGNVITFSGFKIFPTPERSSAKVAFLGDRTAAHNPTWSTEVDTALLSSDMDTTNVVAVGDMSDNSYALTVNDTLKAGLGGKIYPAVGNHDYDLTRENDFAFYFGLDGAQDGVYDESDMYYSVVLGNVEYFFLDDNPENSHNNGGIDASSAAAFEASTMGTWLNNALDNSTAPWKIVVTHHPAYSSTTHYSDVPSPNLRWDWSGKGVNMVLCGHEHVNERIFVSGIPFVVHGKGGAGNHPFGEIDPNSQYMFTENAAMKVHDSQDKLVTELFDTRPASGQWGTARTLLHRSLTLKSPVKPPAPKVAWLTSAPQQYLSGEGTFWNPYDCSDRDKFDSIMSKMPSGTVINLLPGTYHTRGRSENPNLAIPGEFTPKNNWYIKGAGIGKTTLKLEIREEDNRADGAYSLFMTRWQEIVNDFTIQDLTIDLSVWDISQHTQFSPMAVTIIGDRNHVKNIEVVDWGNISAINEAFLISLGAQRDYSASIGSTKISSYNIIEDVKINKPRISGLSNAYNTCLIVGGGNVGGKLSHNDIGIIRNCTIDGTISGSLTGNFSNSSVIGHTITSSNYAISMGNILKNIQIAGPYTDSWQSHRLICMNNKYYNVRGGPRFALGNTANSGLFAYYEGGLREAFVKYHEFIMQGNDIYLRQCDTASTDCRGVIIFCSNLSHYKTPDSNPPSSSQTVYGWIMDRFVCKNNSVQWYDKLPAVGGQSYSFVYLRNVSGAHIENNYIDLPSGAQLSNTSGAIHINSKFHGSGCSGTFVKDNNCNYIDFEWMKASGHAMGSPPNAYNVSNYLSHTGVNYTPGMPS